MKLLSKAPMLKLVGLAFAGTLLVGGAYDGLGDGMLAGPLDRGGQPI